MITVQLVGGLGNQMFQYAAARALADRLETNLALDTTIFNTYKVHPYRLNNYRLRADEASLDDLKRWPSWKKKISSKVDRKGRFLSCYTQDGIKFNSDLFDLEDNSYLIGYFQSEKYFKEISEGLKHDFELASELNEQNKQFRTDIANNESVMIHVRRGDYISNPEAYRVHGVCSIEYYNAAIRFINEEVNNPRYFVFSNDAEWAKENLNLPEDSVFSEGNYDEPEVDIHLMSCCKHFIIANSSFSWWGAWLGETSRSKVVYPDPWFDDKTLDSFDIVPERWVPLKK